MAKRGRAAVLPTNIALLQDLVKRDPQSYKEEFKVQHQHYDSLRNIHLANPRAAQNQDEFAELIGFITHVCSAFPKDTKDFPSELTQLISENYDSLSFPLAEKIIQSLTMLRNRAIIDDQVYIETLFPILISTESKQLRTQCYASLISMLKNVNQPVKSPKTNKMVQALLFNLLENAESNGLWATKIVRELWKRGIWDDSRSVEIMTQAALHSDSKVASSAIRFFLGADQEREDAMHEEDSDNDIDMDQLKHRLQINKKSRKGTKKLRAAASQVKKKKNGPGKDATHLNFSAIHLLRDPQSFVEKLYSTHLVGSGSGARLNLDQKISCINLASRLIGVHKLTVLGVYSFLLKYLTPKQRDVTQFMAAAAQASHDLVPPDVLNPMVRKIADEFVSDGVASEVAAAGLNTIREIVTRAPLAIDEPLLHDLIIYRGSKAKAVNMAAKGLVTLFREIDPGMLPAKERGKTAQMAYRAGEIKRPEFGQVSAGGIDGLELLDQWKENNADEGEEKDGWEMDSDSDASDISGEWVTVEDEKDYAVSDSDDDNKDDQEKAAGTEKPAKSLEEIQKLAATEILTPADFAKLDELKNEAGVRKALGQTNEEIVEAMKLQGNTKFKQTKEERIATAREGKDDREFGSRKKAHAEKKHSTTNKQKARKKNFMMMIHNRDVQGKAKRSLRDKQKVLRTHIKKQKMKKK